MLGPHVHVADVAELQEFAVWARRFRSDVRIFSVIGRSKEPTTNGLNGYIARETVV